ncbi:hypothetical protein LDENG_00097880 [Lucifuga dentata]|nr:hypothetical protein LDENG_00097880 [Lucifuga dentata]
MGIEEETDRTLFIRNLDSRVTEELLFELFLQAGPLIKTKIPKDSDGKQKSFGFAVYKHEVSVPYAMQLLNGTSLFGRAIHVQFRSGSSHSSTGNSQNSSPVNTPNPHGQRTQMQFISPPYTPPQMQRSFSSPDNLQKHVMMNNMMWQLHTQQQLEQVNGGFPRPLQKQHSASGNAGSCSSRQHDSAPYRQHPPQVTGGSRGQRYADEQSSSRQQQHSYSRDSYHHHSERRGAHHHDNRAGNRHHEGSQDGYRGYQDNRRRRH